MGLLLGDVDDSPVSARRAAPLSLVAPSS